MKNNLLLKILLPVTLLLVSLGMQAHDVPPIAYTVSDGTNSDTATLYLTTLDDCVDPVVFFEDFGTSAAPTAANDYGRTTSPYMPAGSGTFGSIYRGFMNLPSTRSEQTSYHKAHDPDRRFYLYVKAGERITVLSGIEHNNRNTYEVEI